MPILSYEGDSMERHVPLEDLEIYKLAQEIGELIWSIVNRWDNYQRNAIGFQFVRAADSISASIAVGYGRYFYKDRRNFCYYGRGSIMETKTWAKKTVYRNLITVLEYQSLTEKLDFLHLRLNGYIKSLQISAG